MKVYLCYTFCHHKNLESIRKMLTRNRIEFVESSDTSKLNESFDYVLCFDRYLPPHYFPSNCRVIYGPHFFVFPDDQSHPIWKNGHDNRFVYNTLSEWNLNTHRRICPSIQFVARPFGIDTDSIPIANPQRSKIMVYCKHRNRALYKHVFDTLSSKHVEYVTVTYGSYNDTDFKKTLVDTKFVVWVGCHESQGFAFQETLAMNVPILVRDVRTMCDEVGNNGQPAYSDPALYATTASYWSDECGLKFHDASEFSGKFDEMVGRYNEFEPRKFIERELSLDAAFKKMFI